MELELKRTWYPADTNGQLLLDGVTLCAAIELPWRNNMPQVSCIPEDRCIVPVTVLTGPGIGLRPGEALSGLTVRAFNALQRKDPVFLTIKKDHL